MAILRHQIDGNIYGNIQSVDYILSHTTIYNPIDLGYMTIFAHMLNLTDPADIAENA